VSSPRRRGSGSRLATRAGPSPSRTCAMPLASTPRACAAGCCATRPRWRCPRCRRAVAACALAGRPRRSTRAGRASGRGARCAWGRSPSGQETDGRALAAEDVARERGAQVPPRRAVHGAQEAPRRERALLVREKAHDVVERALPTARAADLLVDPAHDEGSAVVEGGRLARAREIEAPAAVACEAGDAAREARLREPPGVARAGGRR